MELQVDVWLRGTDFAKTQIISDVATDPAAWTDHDVSKLLKAMLLAIHRAKNPELDRYAGVPERFSWIVNPFEDSGVVVAIEIQTGAAVAGPFRIDKKQLEDMISRAIAQPPLIRNIDPLNACLRHRGTETQRSHRPRSGTRMSARSTDKIRLLTYSKSCLFVSPCLCGET